MPSHAYMIEDAGGSTYESSGSLYDRAGSFETRDVGEPDYGISADSVARAFSEPSGGDASRAKEYIDDSVDAGIRYWLGDGGMVEIGPESKRLLMEHPRVLAAYENLKSGNTISSGRFGVDMESYVYHIGDTVVKYDTGCNGRTCTTTFTGFYKDGVWDVIRPVDEWYDSPADGKGSSWEAGGTPYDYTPYTWELSYPQPSGWNDRTYPDWTDKSYFESWMLPKELKGRVHEPWKKQKPR